jgi:hypothetical protein
MHEARIFGVMAGGRFSERRFTSNSATQTQASKWGIARIRESALIGHLNAWSMTPRARTLSLPLMGKGISCVAWA